LGGAGASLPRDRILTLTDSIELNFLQLGGHYSSLRSPVPRTGGADEKTFGMVAIGSLFSESGMAHLNRGLVR
jgi:hypothetical protein